LRLASLLALAAAGTPQWSPPAVLSACPAASAPRVVFPSDAPDQATGPGAVVWSASAHCPGGEGARVAPIAAGVQPGAPEIPRTAGGRPIVPRGPLAASGAPHGQIAIAGSLAGTPAEGLLIQGTAGGPFSTLASPGGSAAPRALATGYLGDLAIVSPPTFAAGAPLATVAEGHEAGALDFHVERFFAHEFNRNAASETAGDGPVQTLALAMDYRSETLAVWVQAGSLYARLLPGTGAARAIQRLAPVGSHPALAALLSDDRRAIVAWSEQKGRETAIYIDRSAVGVRFGEPHLLERFRDPDGLPPPAASPTLVRLSSEGVMLAWAGSESGRWVVRTAPVTLGGVGAVSTIAAPDGDALLADLAPGPDSDAQLLWTEPQPGATGRPDMALQAIFAARGLDGAFGEAQQLAPPAPVGGATVALEPDSDRAVAVWQAQDGSIEYSIRPGNASL
jgi:hypothetical protein